MFPKNDIELMYSTRIPFEESTVYSQINIKSPDLNRFSKFKVNLS
jgi:HSPB1-associated protein 1